jgi:hypothetical protein
MVSILYIQKKAIEKRGEKNRNYRIIPAAPLGNKKER